MNWDSVDEAKLNPLIRPDIPSDRFQTMPGPETERGVGVVLAFVNAARESKELTGFGR